MLRDGSGADSQKAWVLRRLLIEWLIQPRVHIFEVKAIWRQHSIDATYTCPEPEAGKKALRLDRAEKIAQ